MKLAVVGKDVSQSDSPAIHMFLTAAFNVPCSYERVSIPPEQFPLCAEELFTRFDAFNVTIPFKESILPFLREVRGDAKDFGAVNTVTSADRTGYNTDGRGFALLLEDEGIAVKGKRVLVLGAGGAGRSCIRTLATEGAEVFAYERDERRLETVHHAIGGFTPLKEVEEEAFDVIVNCTGVGMHDTVGSLPSVRSRGREVSSEPLLRLCGAAVDLIYVPARSQFLLTAASFGKKTANGASMLFYQAYWAECIFLNRTPSAAEAISLWKKYREAET